MLGTFLARGYNDSITPGGLSDLDHMRPQITLTPVPKKPGPNSSCVYNTITFPLTQSGSLRPCRKNTVQSNRRVSVF